MTLVRRVEWVGGIFLGQVENFGRFTLFIGATLSWLFHGQARWCRASILTPQFFAIGVMSLPVIILVGLFVGMVLAVEAYDQFAAIGQETALGGIINISVVKQVGPVLASVMLAGRVGGSVSAQLGTMRVTEQLDALRVMGADPIPYLVVPRVLACLVMVPVLTLISDVMGIFGGYAVTVWGFNVNASSYWEFSAGFISNYEVFVGLGKSVVFGVVIGLVSCYKGFYCQSGAAGVGRAATDAFVTSFIAIIAANFFLAKFFKDFYVLLYGHQGSGGL